MQFLLRKIIIHLEYFEIENRDFFMSLDTQLKPGTVEGGEKPMEHVSYELKMPLRARPPKQFDYDFANLAYADLKNADLSNCSMRFAILTGTDFQNARIDNTCFEKAIFDSETRLPFSLGEAFMRGMILKVRTDKGSELFYHTN